MGSFFCLAYSVMDNTEQLVTEVDPITGILTQNWASVGGWGLFLILAMLIITGAFRGWWVPGWMYRQQSKTLDQAMEQNKTLLVAAEITQHFFKATTPSDKKRGEEDAE